MKKRVKVAIPKISDFRTFLDSKLKVNIPELKKDTNLSEPVSFNESILERVSDTTDEKPRVTSKRLQRQREFSEVVDKKSKDSDNSKKGPLKKLSNVEESNSDPILESVDLQSEPVPLELVKDQSDQIETKVPLLHQNLIGIKSITYSYK